MDFTALAFDDVSRNFGRRRALTRVSFGCQAGEILALLGPNGAGKSTLLSITATLLQPSAGTVRYGQHTARSAGASLRERIGLLGHDLYLYPELSASENLLFFARMHGLRNAEARVSTALETAGLDARRDDMVAGFSRGMRQRLALERALLHGPRLVLLDEPFTGLDDAATGALQQRLAGLRDQGCIVLVTTHDLETIEPIADRAVMLRNGRLVSIESGSGTLRERYRKASAEPTGAVPGVPRNVRPAGIIEGGAQGG
jgi:heme ABC exporter ATP-binding subunit CcmA